MKKYIIVDKTVLEVMADLKGRFTTDHFIGGRDGTVEVIVDDTEIYLDSIGLTGEPYIEDEEVPE